MLARNEALCRIAAATLLLGALATSTAFAQTAASREPTLRERLVAGLQVRRPSEFEFIDAVVDSVERGDLPQRLVDRFFFWARNRPPRSVGSTRPIIYFQAGLTEIAKQQDITIEANPGPTPLTVASP
ncbi:MAG: hypothetical protein ACRCT8_09405 [Lacipirellulaceae bacterium]